MIDKRCLIIAEAGVNHNNSLDQAIALCNEAKRAGADVVKFQTWKTDSIITKNVAMADYQKNNIGNSKSQYEMLKELELSYEKLRKIKKHCDEIGITFASTADEKESLDFLLELGIPFIKVGSGDVGNIPFLRYVGSKGLPVILSTGMSSLADVDISITALKQGGVKDITLLHCTTNYPCSFEDVNLRAMKTLRDAFHLPVGYSDHTLGTEVSVSAVALGACVIEKHFTLDRTMDGPDHAASIGPEEFKRMVDQIRNIEKALGDGIKRMTLSESSVKNVITKRIVAKRVIETGELFSDENVCVKRSNDGELASMWDRVIGRVSLQDYKPDQGVDIL